jgi:hypothetical protein
MPNAGRQQSVSRCEVEGCGRLTAQYRCDRHRNPGLALRRTEAQ